MKQKSLLKNTMYNFIYTGLNLFFPLITAPYISKILGASNLGKVNFATTIVNWFILFAVYGTTTYGTREIAKHRDNKEKMESLFSEIVVINGILSIITAVIYYMLVFNIELFYEELPLYIVMSLSIVLNMFSIDWFYQGIEEYRYITIRSSIFKIISLICTFIFIQKKEHYVIFALISILATSLSGVLNYFYSKKFVHLRFKDISLTKHFKSLTTFFVHTFIVSIYNNLDQVLLGFLRDTKTVAFMSRSKSITAMLIAVSTAITNATLPRASYYKENDEIKFRHLLSMIPKYILWITIPMTVSCIILASDIMFLLGGNEFLEASSLLRIMAPRIIFSPLSAYLQYQVLVASGEEKAGMHSAMIASFSSIILNLILIPKFGVLGAGIVSVISEFSGVITRLYYSKEQLGYKEIQLFNKSTGLYLISSFLMAITMIIINVTISNMYISVVIAILGGFFIYCTVLIILKEALTLSILSKTLKYFQNIK